ncbi:FAD-dependent 5-carboxymethylaminomethyl-2-thiouridine(34) oxidoreductase MnmC [Kiloniella sp.]|uniref:FAD-dependent 5-carboxymethylaminomethyl-2-thiouridine(34) oxidoreductase MnmC n=1 Tax=Kiloniella sp. TaxID=1938587 RepID=UPI003B01E994
MSIPPWFQLPEHVKDRLNKVAIIGGGIAGNTLAYHLNCSGVEVTLFEKKEALAKGASGNPAAIFEPKLMRGGTVLGQYLASSYLYALKFYEDLEKETGESIWHHRGGTLNLIADEKDLKRHQSFQDNTELPRDHYFIADPVQASDLAGVSLSQSAMWYPKGGCINTSTLARALTKNINIKLVNEISSIEELSQNLNSNWRLHFSDGSEPLDFDACIMANAFSIRKFGQSKFLPVVMNRGQVSTHSQVGISKNLKCVVSGAGYLTPLIDGKHVFGATFERLRSFEEADDSSLTDDRHEHNLSFLREYLPFFEKEFSLSELKGRTSVRGTTVDRLPLVGPLHRHADYVDNYGLLKNGAKHRKWEEASYYKGLYVAAGFGSRGFVTAPFMARYLTALITGDEIPVSDTVMQGVHPARFVIRDLKRGIETTLVDA